jgi:hypothetical protein
VPDMNPLFLVNTSSQTSFECAYALFTNTSTSLNPSGNPSIKALISSGLLTSNCLTHIFTPSPTSFVMAAEMSCRRSTRRAVRISLRFWGEVRANSKAVLRPMPEDAPVIRMVLPDRFLDIDVDGGMMQGCGSIQASHLEAR